MLHNKKVILFLVCLFSISLVFSARASMEFTSAKTYARIEKNLEKAAEFGLKALDKEPENSYVPYFLAKEVFMMQKKQKEAGQMFIEALNRPDSKLEKPFRMGDTKYKTVHQAVSLYALDFHNKAIEFYNNGNTESAKEMTEISLKLDPQEIRNYLLLSEISANNNDTKLAMEYLNIALDKNISSKETYDIKLQKVTYLRKDKKFDEAIKLLETLQEENSEDILLKRSIFFTYIDMGDIDIAIPYGTDLFTAMEDDPNVPMSLISECAFNLGILYRNQGSTLYNNEVIKYFSDQSPNNVKTNLQIDNCYKVIESFELAKDNFQNSSNYDESGNNESKTYKKEMRKLIKNMKNEVIPQLEALLK